MFDTQDKTGTPDSTKTSTFVTPEKNDRKRKNIEGMGDIDDAMAVMTVLQLICLVTKKRVIHNIQKCSEIIFGVLRH